MPADIEKDIYRTLAYFSYFGYPLTVFEVWKWLLEPAQEHSFGQILETLETSSWLQECTEAREGFYCLRSKKHGGIDRQLAMRRRRFLNANRKYQKLRRVMKYLMRLPFIQGIAICNSLVFHHTREGSDIDLFVIAKPGKIWSSRFFAVLPLMLLRQRPGEAKENPVDISFYITSDELNLMKFRLSEDDPYMSYWVRSLVPIFGREEVFQLFVRHNAWAKIPLPNSLMPRRARAFRFKPLVKLPFVPFSEGFLRLLQERKFPQDIRDAANADNRVVVSETVLKFHKNDRREEIRDALKKKMSIFDEAVS